MDANIVKNLPWRSDDKEFELLSEGKGRPIAIWNRRQATLYYKSAEEVRDAWNAYAQAEADRFNNNPHLDSYDSTNTVISIDPETGEVTSWTPPLTFEAWLKTRAIR